MKEERPALAGLQRVLRNAKHSKEDIAGPLRIAGPRTTFQPIVWRLLDELCELHPGIRPDVHLEDRVRNRST